MIYKQADNGTEYKGVQVPKSYYKFIQQIAFKHNRSTKAISTSLMNIGIRYMKNNHKDFKDLVDFYEWYHDAKSYVHPPENYKKGLNLGKMIFDKCKDE